MSTPSNSTGTDHALSQTSTSTSTPLSNAIKHDPSKWPAHKKWSAILTACLTCFLVGINSTAILSATEEIVTDFDLSSPSADPKFDYTFFLATSWNAAAALLPLIILPAMEDFGIRPIFLPIYLVFLIFVVVQAVAPNFATLLGSRAVAGACGGVLQNAVDGMIADIWIGDDARTGLALSIFIFVLLGGVTFGPVFGGLIIRSLGWRWISYIQLIIYVILAPLIFFLLHETRPSTNNMRQSSLQTRLKEALNETVLRAGRMLCTEFVLFSFTLWSAFAFGTVFMLTQSIPLVYGSLYEWSAWQSGVVQAAVFIGEILGLGLCTIQDAVVYPRFSRPTTKSNEQTSECGDGLESQPARSTPSSPKDDFAVDHSTLETYPANPEARLYTAIPGSFLCLTAGFFIYAWTTTSSSSSSATHSWALPTFSLLLIGIGITTVVQAVATYITDFYSSRANSAVSAVAFGENILAAFLPLATKAMYGDRSQGGLGFQWASSLLGFVALILSFAPVALVVFGKRMRKRSRFSS